MLSGEVWLKVPETIRFILTGKPGDWVEGKDIILYIIGDIGVDGALYRAMEYQGDGLRFLNMAWRFTMSNMAIEAGAKNGIFPYDDITEEYLKKRAGRRYRVFEPDGDALYSEERSYDLSSIEPQVAFPHLPENTKPVSEAEGIYVDQVVIGSCTNGRIEDLRSAARVLKGNRVYKGIRLIILPATQEIYLQAVKEGLIELFIEAGGVVSTPTCGPCLGGHMGVLAAGEQAVATTNRNFVGRMGHPESEVYLTNPAVAAATAVAGKITSPKDVVLRS